MRRVMSMLVVIGVLASLTLIPSAAGASAEFTEYTGIETAWAPPTDVVIRPAGDSGILHLTQTSYYHDTTTDPRMNGNVVVSSHATITDFFAGDAIVWGTVVIFVDGYDATWEGRWAGEMEGFEATLKLTGQATGELEGLKMMATLTPAGPDLAIAGRILEPAG